MAPDRLFEAGTVSVEDRIGSPKEIYPLLGRYGIKFIVIEDRPSGSIVLDWLRDELRGDRFIERRRIGFDSAGPPLPSIGRQGFFLVVGPQGSRSKIRRTSGSKAAIGIVS